jgi:hypothetical protein
MWDQESLRTSRQSSGSLVEGPDFSDDEVLLILADVSLAVPQGDASSFAGDSDYERPYDDTTFRNSSHSRKESRRGSLARAISSQQAQRVDLVYLWAHPLVYDLKTEKGVVYRSFEDAIDWAGDRDALLAMLSAGEKQLRVRMDNLYFGTLMNHLLSRCS